MAFQLAHSFILANYLENWKLKFFLITTQVMLFVFVCLFSATVKDYTLWKLVTLICEKVVSLKFAIWFHQLHIAQPWSCLEQRWRLTIFWSIHHIPAWFFTKTCFAIGLIAPGCWCHTHVIQGLVWYVLQLRSSMKELVLQRGQFSDFSKFAGNWVLTWYDLIPVSENYVRLMYLFFG